jgi:hypothetical protein
MNRPRRIAFVLAAIATYQLSSALAQQPANSIRQRPRLPGMGDGGTVLLPNQWSLKPAGKQIKLGDFPVQIALHPSERWAAVLHTGYGDHLPRPGRQTTLCQRRRG